jgi:fermentation-respiration switch protein FrsA (DUF1100 family)
MARVVAGDNIMAHNPYEAVEMANGRPLAVVHGTADGRIHVRHSYQLQERALQVGANAVFWFPEGVDHIQAASVQTNEYEARLVSFFEESLLE